MKKITLSNEVAETLIELGVSTADIAELEFIGKCTFQEKDIKNVTSVLIDADIDFVFRSILGTQEIEIIEFE